MPFSPILGAATTWRRSGSRAARAIGWTAVAFLGVTALKLAFWDILGPSTPFLLYFAVVAVAAWFGGWPSGLVASGLTALAGTYFFLPPYYSVAFTERAPVVRLLVYLLESLVVTGLAAQLRAERSRAAAARLQLEGVLLGVADGITVQTPSGRLRFVNEAAARMAGFASPAEMQSVDTKTITERFELREPDGRPLDVATLPGRLVLQGLPAPERLVRFRVRATGAERVVLVRATPIQIPEADGTTELAAVNVFQDVTEKYAQEEALRISEEWFSTTLHSIGDAVIATDDRGVVRLVNPIAERLTGWPSAEAVGRPLSEIFRIVHESTRQPVESPVERVLREGKVVGLANHTVLLGRDGREVAIDDSAAPIRGAKRPLAGTVLIFRDISERRAEERRRAFAAQAAVELGSSLDIERTLATVVRLAVPAIADWCALDLLEDGQLRRLAVQHIDPRKIELVYEIERRYPPDPATDPGVYAVVRTGQPVFVPEIPEGMLAAAAKDPEHLSLIQRLELRSYIAVPLLVNGATIGVLTLAMAESGRSHDQRDLEMAVALADRAALAVTNARLFEDSVKARGEAETANRAKDQFLAILGHELRNPLSPISTAVQLMKRKAPGVLERERGIIERQLKHVTRLIDDLLDVSRITSGKIKVARERVDLANTIARALEAAGPLLEEGQHEVVVDVPAGLEVDGDAERLVQVATNLISNAAKYTPRRGRIEIVGRRQGASVELRVADNGSGLDPEILPRVFDRFVQGPQEVDRAKGGLGLGLSIVRSVVELHGGRVSASSDGRGRGSTFRVELPATSGAPTPPRPTATPAASAPGSKVLIVDDNEDALELLAESLTLAGHDCVTASDPLQALDRAAAEHPQMALLDIGLPVMDGYELARRLRELPGQATMKLVAVTGYGQDTDKERARAAGFDDHLVKPISVEQVEAIVARMAPRPDGQAAHVD